MFKNSHHLIPKPKNLSTMIWFNRHLSILERLSEF